MGRLCCPLAFWQEIRKKHRLLIVSWESVPGRSRGHLPDGGTEPLPIASFSPSAFDFPGHTPWVPLGIFRHLLPTFLLFKRVLGFFQCVLLAWQVLGEKVFSL